MAMRDETKIWAWSAVAQKDRTATVGHVLGDLRAMNHDEAIGKAYRMARMELPDSEGYGAPMVLVKEIKP